MCLGIEKELALDAGGSGDFELQGVFAIYLGVADEGHGDFALFGIEQMRIVVLRGGFELQAFGADKGGGIAGGGLMPGGFAVVGFDEIFVAEEEFGVIAVGEARVEGVGAGFFVRGVGEGSFEGERLNSCEGFGAAFGFDVLADCFLRILSACGNKGGGRKEDRERNEQT